MRAGFLCVTVLIGVGAAACTAAVVSGPLGPEETARTAAGVRLRPLAWVPADGTSVVAPRLFDDPQLARCALTELTEDGRGRCMPGGYGGAYLLSTDGGPPFVDAECSTAAVYPAPCATGPVFIRDAVRDAGANARLERAFRFTDRPVDVSGPVYDHAIGGDDAGRCLPLSDRIRAYEATFFGAAHVAAELVAEAEMVAVEGREESDLGGGLRDVTRRWEDGTVERFRELTIPCFAASTVDGALRCVPALAATTSTLAFADAACETLIWRSREPLDAGADPVLLRVGLSTPAGDIRATVGATEAFAETYRLRGEDCEPAGPATAVRLSAPLPLDSFMALERRAVGSGRLRPVRLLDADGRAWPVAASDRSLGSEHLGGELGFRPTYRDGERDEDCLPGATAEIVRCVPLRTLRHDVSFEPTTGIFLDSECTEQVRWAAGALREEVAYVAEWGFIGEGCDRRQTVLHLREAGAPLPAETPLFRLHDGTCSPWEASHEHARAYRVNGPEVDLRALAAFRASPYDP